MSEEDSRPEGSAEVEFRTKWEDAIDLPVQSANQLYISSAGGQFYLVFGQAFPPLVAEEPGESPTVHVTPVARLAICPEAMLSIAAVIGTNVSRFVARANVETDE